MRIVMNEMKKIWDLKMLALVGVISVLFFLLFMEFNITDFPNGHPHTERYDFSKELTLKYGTTLEKSEFDEFMQKRKELVAKAEDYITSDPAFLAAGIHNYEDYKIKNERSENSKAEKDAIWHLLGKECDFVEFKIQAFDSIADDYNNAAASYKHYISKSGSPKEKARLQEILDTEQYRSIILDHTIDNTGSYILWLAILVVLSVLILLSPLLVNDKMRGVDVLQYTSKKGRKVLSSQLWAVLISAILLTTIELAAAAGIYSINNTQIFWNNGMNSFIGRYVFWFDMTFGQYVLFSAFMIYLCALGSALIAYVIAGMSQHYIQLILKLIPVFILLVLICQSVFDVSFSMSNILYQLTGILGIETIICGIVFIIGIFLCIMLVQRMRRADI